ncbi:MAG: ribbon-helix-helix domain-containing protein [Anaerolineae bacterium]
MIRTQVQLTDEQMRRLRHLASTEGVSIAEIIRRSVDAALAVPYQQDEADKRQRALSVIGAFRSGKHDVSAQHDRYLAEALDECRSS